MTIKELINVLRAVPPHLDKELENTHEFQMLFKALDRVYLSFTDRKTQIKQRVKTLFHNNYIFDYSFAEFNGKMYLVYKGKAEEIPESITREFIELMNGGYSWDFNERGWSQDEACEFIDEHPDVLDWLEWRFAKDDKDDEQHES